MPLYIYGFYFPTNDSLYTFSIILLLIGIVISFIAQASVNSTFKKYSTVSARFTGEQAARRLLESQGVYDVKIESVSGNLSDHFDPRTNTIRLSEGVFNSASVAAVGVACHEAGHALQYATHYAPIKLRNFIIPVTRFGSSAAFPLIMLGLIFSFYPLALLGVVFYGLAVLFQLITLPVEFNASRRALTAIKEGALLDDNSAGAAKVLSAAALTYVAALLVSLAQFLRLFAMVNRRRR